MSSRIALMFFDRTIGFCGLVFKEQLIWVGDLSKIQSSGNPPIFNELDYIIAKAFN